MGTPVTGSATAMTWDADGGGAAAAINVGMGTTYEYEEETQTEEQGPFFGQPEITEVPSGEKYSMKISGTIPEGTDAGQDAIQASRASKVRGTLVVYTLKGKQITMTSCLIKKFSLKGEAKGSQTFELEASGIGAVTDAPTS